MLSELKMVGDWFKNEHLGAWDFNEIRFDEEAQKKISCLEQANRNFKISEYTTKVELSGKSINHYYIPCQYFLYALKIRPMLTLIQKYIEVFDSLKNSHSQSEFIDVLRGIVTGSNSIKNLDPISQLNFLKIFKTKEERFDAKSIVNKKKEKTTTEDLPDKIRVDEFIEQIGIAGDGNEKYILRSVEDFFRSIILKVIPVPDESSKALGELLLQISSNEELSTYIQGKYGFAIPWLFCTNDGDELLLRIMLTLGWEGKLDHLQNVEPVSWGEISDAFLVRPTPEPNNSNYISTPIHYLENYRKYVFVRKGLLNTATLDMISKMVEELWPDSFIEYRDSFYFFKYNTKKANQNMNKSDLIKAFKIYVSSEVKSRSTLSNYLIALNEMPPFLRSIGVDCPNIWSEDVIREKLCDAVAFVKTHKNNKDGIFKNYPKPSHYKRNFFSAAVKKYLEFLDTLLLTSETIVENEDPAAKLFDMNAFLTDLVSSNIKFPPFLPIRFASSLLSKPFVILTGLAGSGKTKLAEAFSSWIASDEESQVCMVAVGADWTNREPLLGYPNALDTTQYIMPDSGILHILLEAEKNPDLPYFLILDEMNMSHVERYFADFLSAMESDSRVLKLHSNAEGLTAPDGTAVPSTVKIGANLFIIGTVNIDETTYMFSPKVLDRAQVIEFRVSPKEMEDFLANPLPINMDELRGEGSSMGADFVNLAKTAKDKAKPDLAVLNDFFKELQSVGAEFGYRTAAEIATFIAVCNELNESLETPMGPNEIVDAAIMQKLLPKVHGSRNKIEKVLKLLIEMCKDGAAVKYPLSNEKLERMHKRVIADGFTSFAEA